MTVTSWESRWCFAGADNLKQIENMSLMKSAVGGHPSLWTILLTLCGNALWRIVASQLQNSAIISWSLLHKIVMGHMFRELCARWVPKQLTPEHNAKHMESAWHFCSGIMMKSTNFWTGSSQVMKYELHTLPQKLSSSQCIGITVDLPARRNSSRYCWSEKWCTRFSGTDGAFSSLTS